MWIRSLSFILVAAVVAGQPSPIVSTVEPDFGPDRDRPKIMLPTMVNFVVLPDGTPHSVSGNGVAFPDPVARAFAKYRFQPAKQPYETTVFLGVPFVLDKYTGHTRGAVSLPQEITRPATQIKAGNLEKFEASLKPGPESASNRAAVVLATAGQPGAAMLAARSRQLEWLIENAPNSPILKTKAATLAREDAPETYQDLKQSWIAALAKRPGEIGRLEAATNFLRVSDPEEVHRILLPFAQSAVQVQEWLGEAYAFASVGLASLGTAETGPKFSAPTAFAEEAHKRLEAAELPMLLSAFHALSNVKFTAAAGKTALPETFLPFCEFVRGRIRDHQPGAPLFCTPPAVEFSSGAPATARENVGSGVTRGLLKNQVRPAYPDEAKRRGIQGEVILAAVIGTDGKIKGIELLHGVLPLYASAYDAVRQWEYKPYLLDGRPVEVLTEIEVNYAILR